MEGLTQQAIGTKLGYTRWTIGRLIDEARDSLMKGVTLEGVNAIRVIGGAMEPLTERGVIEPEDFPLCRYLYQIIEHDTPLDMPFETFFGGMK